jgi:DNA-directed RNA polymerase specialized sigma24 family protein
MEAQILEYHKHSGAWPSTAVSREWERIAEALRRRGTRLVEVVERLGGPPAPQIINTLSEQEKRLLQYLPLTDAQMLMAYHNGVKQRELGDQYIMTQAAVSYRLKRARERLEFLKHYPQLSRSTLRRLLGSLGYEQQRITILTELYITTCQLTVAAAAGVTQGRVRHYLYKAIKHLGEVVYLEKRHDFTALLHGFELIRDNPAILHEQPPPPFARVRRTR